MRRHSQFTVDAESVQGNAGATVTFSSLLVREVDEIRAGGVRDLDLLQAHVLHWTGFVDDEGAALPGPDEDVSVLGRLYVQEQAALVRLLLGGPDADEGAEKN